MEHLREFHLHIAGRKEPKVRNRKITRFGTAGRGLPTVHQLTLKKSFCLFEVKTTVVLGIVVLLLSQY